MLRWDMHVERFFLEGQMILSPGYEEMNLTEAFEVFKAQTFVIGRLGPRVRWELRVRCRGSSRVVLETWSLGWSRVIWRLVHVVGCLEVLSKRGCQMFECSCPTGAKG